MKVSVVIPTHNRANLIKKALESVLGQTHQDLEIIIVSDGSTDDTDLIVNEYRKKDTRIKYISYTPAKGGNFARNTGIEAASGDYVAFLDDDDEWEPLKIELQLQEFNKNSNIGLVYTGVNIIYDYENLNYVSLPKKTGDLSDEILVSNYIGTTSSVMIKSNVLEKTGLFDENLKARQDYDLWIRVCQFCHIGAVNKPLVKYYNYKSSKQVSDDIKKYEVAIKYIEEKYCEHYKKIDKKLLIKHQQSVYMSLANRGLRNNNPKIARMYLRAHFKEKANFQAIAMYCLSFLKYETILKIRSART